MSRTSGKVQKAVESKLCTLATWSNTLSRFHVSDCRFTGAKNLRSTTTTTSPCGYGIHAVPRGKHPIHHNMDHTIELPADILCRIFLLVQALDPIPYPGHDWVPDLSNRPRGERRDLRVTHERVATNTITSRRLAWVVLTHVSRRWRAIALEHWGLWTSPTLFLGQKWLYCMHARSHGALLSLSGRELGFELDLTPTRSRAVEMGSSLIRGYSRNIRSLHFSTTHGLLFLQTPFDALEEFILDTRDSGLRFYETDVPVPSGALNLFDGQAPSLRSLHLSVDGMKYEQLPAGSPLWNRLEHLHLALDGALSSILPILRRSLSLHSLHLYVQYRYTRDQSNRPPTACDACLGTNFNSIVIPSLQSMFLYGCIRTLGHLLNHFRCQPTLNIQIHSKSDESSEATVLSQIRRAIAFDDVRAPAARAVALIGNERAQMSISSDMAALLSYHPRPTTDGIHNDSDTQLCLTLHYKHIREFVPRLSGTKILTITRPFSASAGASADGVLYGYLEREDFTSFTQLRHLTISGGDINLTLALLDLRATDDPSAILFPSLTTLSIGGSLVWSLIKALPNHETMQTVASWLHQITKLRREVGNRPVSVVYVHIQEELVDIDAERWDLTSCSKYLHNVGKVVKERLEPMRTIPGYRCVPYDTVVVLGLDESKRTLVRRGD